MTYIFFFSFFFFPKPSIYFWSINREVHYKTGFMFIEQNNIPPLQVA